ncbi:hypothetical protein [Nocardia nepalensis]|uniref:hypothetical protein n=1 Tax=Nocardia nepalensis TaxID=3375448 RepID=UPI003B6804E0
MEQSTVRAFAERVGRGELGPDIQVRYRVSGGMPSQRLDCEVVVDSVGGARISRFDAQVGDEVERESIPPERLDVPELLRAVSRGLYSLTPASERMTRLPDSLLGSLTIVVSGAEESFRFVPEQEQREVLGKAVAPSMDRALQKFWNLALGQSQSQGNGS